MKAKKTPCKNKQKNKLPSALKKMKTIQEVHEYYQKIISCMPNNVYWLDKNCITQGCNNNVLNFVGLKTIDEFIGITYEKMGEIAGWSEGHAAIYKKDDMDVMSTGIPKLNIEDPPLHDANGNSTYYLTSRMPVFDNNNEIIGVVGISVDITERKKMEEDIHKAKEAAEAANRAKTEFIANMSHDIRTPLTGVIGLSEMLENTLGDPELKEEAHMIHDSGKELLSMLNGILDDIHAGNMNEDDIHLETFDLHLCMEDLVKLERPTTALKHLELSVDIQNGVPRFIKSDRKKIHRILLNLLGNAIKFTKIGQITVQVVCIENSDDNIHLQFSVADTGIGISKALQDKVFERFFKVTPSYKGIYKGHGLGLNIAQSYIELLGGHVTLTSQENVGTTFSFDIHCQKSSKRETINHQPMATVEIISTPLPSSTNVNHLMHDTDFFVLLVEDNLMALKVLESMVSKAGYRFLSAASGEAAFKLVTLNQFDLIITDIGLPEISGNELTRQIRQWEKENDKKSVPIVGLTGHAKETAHKECLDSGMNDVFTKPITPAVIQSIINQQIMNSIQKEGNAIPPAPANLGPGLPNKEEELFELTHLPLFDIQAALETIPDEKLLLKLLNEFVSDEGQKDIFQMQEAYIKNDWKRIESIAHKVKGGAIYLGICRLQFACQYLERYYKAGHRAKLKKLYQQLLLVNQKTLNMVSDWINKLPKDKK